jgi:gluconokinase
MAALAATLDVGTSSVRARLFDARGSDLRRFAVKADHCPAATDGGGVAFDADALAALCVQVLDRFHAGLAAAGLRPDVVGFSAFWHCFLGVDEDGRPVTPILHLFDTRSQAEAAELARRTDPAAVHARTGCLLHPSYWPAKLLWLRRHRPEAFRVARRWLSFGEYLYLRLHGVARSSVSMASGSGLWVQAANRYDAELLALLGVGAAALAPEEELDLPAQSLRPEFAARWPLLDGIPWYPASGDGACNNVGAGCDTRERWALMIGTSAAVRVVTGECLPPPPGLWTYRVDRERCLTGGALSNGGSVFAWLRRTLRLPGKRALERELAGRAPGAHALTVLPFLGGERSPYWRADLRGVIAGLSLATDPADILHAALEAVALRIGDICALLRGAFPEPAEVVATGGALAESAAWAQIVADAVGRPIALSRVAEASSRGAALLAFRQARIPVRLRPVRAARVFTPRAEFAGALQQELEQQRRLLRAVFG